MTTINQVVAVAIMSYVCTVLGILYTLPSSTIKHFSSKNTALNQVITETEISLMGSISSASTLIITPFCGYLLDRFGRKCSMILFFLPQLLAWILLVSINRVEAFICAMGLCGLSGSIYLIMPIYVNEFCDPSIRGALTSFPVIFNSVGMLTAYGLGGTLEYFTLNYLGLSLAVIGLILITFLRESPLYLMKKGLEEEAAKTIAFYRGLILHCKEVETQIENLRHLLKNDSQIGVIPEMERLQLDTKEPTEKFSILKFLRKSPSTCRAFIVLIIIFTASIFQGIVIVQIFAEPLFSTAVPNISSTLSSIIFGLIVVFSGFLEAYLVEAVGRRSLLIASSTVTGLLCVILATQLQMQWGPGWLTAVLIYLYSITYSCGPGAVPYVLLGEIFLPQIKNFASTIVIEWVHICNFSILFIFTPLFNAFGLGPIFYIFGGFSAFTAGFAFFFLPETKNLPVDVIQRKFLGQKKNKIVTGQGQIIIPK